MKLTGSHVIDAPREKVWQGLMDTDLLRLSIPGCESVTDEGDGAYTAVVTASVGPVRARFKGRLQQQNMKEPEQYGLRFEGEGGIAGFAKGDALVTLREAGEDGAKTDLTYEADAAIGGRLAQIGSRLIDATSKRMANQFFDRFQNYLNDPAALEAAKAGEKPKPEAAEPAVTEPGASAPAGSAAPMPGQVSVQMPAWAWAFTVLVLAALAGWLGTQ